MEGVVHAVAPAARGDDARRAQQHSTDEPIELDDVQSVASNLNITDDIMAAFES